MTRCKYAFMSYTDGAWVTIARFNRLSESAMYAEVYEKIAKRMHMTGKYCLVNMTTGVCVLYFEV